MSDNEEQYGQRDYHRELLDLKIKQQKLAEETEYGRITQEQIESRINGHFWVAMGIAKDLARDLDGRVAAVNSLNQIIQGLEDRLENAHWGEDDQDSSDWNALIDERDQYREDSLHSQDEIYKLRTKAERDAHLLHEAQLEIANQKGQLTVYRKLASQLDGSLFGPESE